MNCSLSEVSLNFQIDVAVDAYGNGHINDTYIADSKPRYILQRINSTVFKNPEQVMSNILNVTDHLRGKILAAGGDVNRETLTVIKTKDGKSFYKSPEGDYFRMYNFIENALSYDAVESPEQFYEAARAFGKFQNMLSDFPADKLYETIPFFHHTEKRFGDANAIVAS